MGRIKAGLHADDPTHENLCLSATPPNVMVVGFRRPELKKYEGKRLSEGIADNKEWRESRPAQVTVPEAGLVDAVRDILARHR